MTKPGKKKISMKYRILIALGMSLTLLYVFVYLLANGLLYFSIGSITG